MLSLSRSLVVVALTAAGILLPAAVVRADLAEIKGRGTLRVLASADEVPKMFDFQPGPHPGFEREIVEGFARLHRLELEVVRVDDFETIIPGLAAGKGDLIIGLIDTPERRKKIDFTSEVLPARHLAVNRKPAAPIETLPALRDGKVAVVGGTSWEAEARKAGVPEASLVAFSGTAELLEGLRSGKADAAVMSLSDYTLSAQADPALQAGLFLGEPTSAAWGVRKSDPQLKAALDEYLASLRRTPSWSRLVVKYFGEDALSVLGRAKK